MSAQFFFGASLTALNKRDGGIRPIAVGCTLRRLVAKMASMSVKDCIGSILAPLQLGYGTPFGAEAAVHSARLYILTTYLWTMFSLSLILRTHSIVLGEIKFYSLLLNMYQRYIPLFMPVILFLLVWF